MGYILAIHEAMKEQHQWGLDHKGQEYSLEGRMMADRVKERTNEAIKAFSKGNGWAERKSFHPTAIGKRNSWYYFDEWGLGFFDHTIFFKKDGQCFAIVAQPYSAPEPPDQKFKDYLNGLKVRSGQWSIEREVKDKVELDIYMPPDLYASFHYPGFTCLFVVAPAGVEVKWLDEQDGRLSDMWRK